jgi:pSer/pThr/pTyr-binding forkhead associated (FHA) protein
MSEEKKEIKASMAKAFVILSNQVFPIDKPVVSIGRKLSNDLVIQSAQVSRNHAEIRSREEGFFLVDLGSTSGTFVNNEKIEESKIYSGDLILIANVPLMFLDEKDPLYKDMEKRTVQLKKRGSN